jgi:hypothetical protein
MISESLHFASRKVGLSARILMRMRIFPMREYWLKLQDTKDLLYLFKRISACRSKGETGRAALHEDNYLRTLYLALDIIRFVRAVYRIRVPTKKILEKISY